MIEAILVGSVSMVLGFFGSKSLSSKKVGNAEAEAQSKINEAKSEAEKIKMQAQDDAGKIRDNALNEAEELRKDIKNQEKRLQDREKSYDSKLDELDRRSLTLRKHEEEIISLKDEIKRIKENQMNKLESLAKLSQTEAADALTKQVEKEISKDLGDFIAKKQKEAAELAEDQAQMIILASMERLASEVTAERTITAIKLESDDVKGKIIGKEGRNIQALQAATGVDILMDDTPGYIVLSCFDPIRRQVARETIELLIKDGRIHPAKIEETVEKAQRNIDKEVIIAAEDACRQVGVTGLPPDILRLLGELKFRTSYGQNVLKHSTEMAHLAAMIATEIGANVLVTKTAALLHDLGKALTHKIEGKHHHISGEWLRKYGMSEAIAHAAEAHHDDLEATTPEAMIVRVVDALSAARPGARNISAENFGARMKDLENIALNYKGVDKAYAISAGREVRILVNSKEVDDLSAIRMSRDIANNIESTMSYPGTIKVSVIRETRAVEYAK